ncbi:Hypothetical predicted protein, partial [Pelobates cultripes]
CSFIWKLRSSVSRHFATLVGIFLIRSGSIRLFLRLYENLIRMNFPVFICLVSVRQTKAALMAASRSSRGSPSRHSSVHEFDTSERSVGGKKSHKSTRCIACDAKALEGKKLCGTCLSEAAGSPKDPSPEIMKWIQMAVDKSMEQ